MINRRLVRAKLDAILLYLRRLRGPAKATRAAFLADHRIFNVAERNVQLVVDAAVDVNNHLILEAGESAAKDYFESFEKLARIRVLPPAQARRLAHTTGLRNRLVHQYESIDLARLHRDLRGFIRAYERYARTVAGHAKA